MSYFAFKEPSCIENYNFSNFFDQKCVTEVDCDSCIPVERKTKAVQNFNGVHGFEINKQNPCQNLVVSIRVLVCFRFNKAFFNNQKV